MKKRLISILLALALLCAYLPQTALPVRAEHGWQAGIYVGPISDLAGSETSGKCGDDLYWNLDVDTRLLTITGRGEMYDYSIDKPAPWYGKMVKSLSLQGLTSIGENAFWGCGRLERVSIPEGVTDIGSGAFENCYWLDDISIPDSVKSIGSYAFSATAYQDPFEYPDPGEVVPSGDLLYLDGWLICAKPGITAVEIHSDTKGIIDSAFFACRKLTKIYVSPRNPNYCSADGALFNKDQTTLIAYPQGRTGEYLLPDSVTTIENGAFSYCSGLTAIHTNAENPNYCSVDGVLFNKDKTTLIAYPQGKAGEYRIPDGVTNINSNAFRGCSSLTGVVFPDSLTAIGDCAFQDCSSLASVTFPENVREIGEGAFDYCSHLTEAIICNPDCVFHYSPSCYSLHDEIFVLLVGPFEDDITIYGYSDSTAAQYAKRLGHPFCGIGDKKRLEKAISDAEEIIRDMYLDDEAITAFDETLAAAKKVLEDEDADLNAVETAIKAVEEAVAALSFLIDKNGVLTKYTGAGGAVTIPDNVTAIGERAFYDCDGLTSVTMGSSVTTIGESAFERCDGLTSVTIGSGVTTIGESAFERCDGLTSVTFGENVATIGKRAFNGCYGLTSVTFGENVATIGESAFEYCIGLTSVTMGSSVTTIGYHAFNYCGKLTNVTFGENVATIGVGAFGYCALTSVAFPNNVKSIGYGAFRGCDLTSVTIPESVGEIGSYAFDCSSLTEATILNRNCVLETETDQWGYDIYKTIEIGPFGNAMLGNKVTIIGYLCSTAEECAYRCGLQFRDIDDRVPPLDRRSLYEAVFETEKLHMDMYIDDETMTALEEALTAAKHIQTDETADQGAVDAAARALRDAIASLRPNENFRFDDVKEPGKYYFDPVYWALMADPQITNGMERYCFRPKMNCTRAQAATFLWRAAGCPEPKRTETPFTDVKPGSFYAKAVAWAVENGITNGMSADKFAPDAKCNRGQIVTFLWRAAGSPEPKHAVTPFTDVKPDAFYAKAVAWGVESEVTNGVEADSFCPQETCTRGQIVTFLYRAMAQK